MIEQDEVMCEWTWKEGFYDRWVTSCDRDMVCRLETCPGCGLRVREIDAERDEDATGDTADA